MIHIEPLGERAFLVRFPNEAMSAAWVEAARAQTPQAIEEIVLAYDTAAVFFSAEPTEVKALENWIRGVAANPRSESPPGRLITLPVLYDGDDLEPVAQRLSLPVETVIALHQQPTYHVYAVGFRPGFPYAGYLKEPLAGLPRRDSPRSRVPAGSVAVAGRQTGVYPEESPGGWHLLGRTPLRIVDLATGRFAIRAGDRLRFLAVTETEFQDRRGEFP